MTKILDDFLGWGRPAKTLTRAELEDELAEHDCAGDKASRVFELQDRFGGTRIQDRRRTDYEIWQTIGVPSTDGVYLDRAGVLLVQFFDFGVAAPYEVALRLDGSVVATNGLEVIDAAASFECFLEGLAHESHVSQRFSNADGINVPRNFESALSDLPLKSRVSAASDHLTTWWHADSWAARLRTIWDGAPPTIDLLVWNPNEAPEGFRQMIDHYKPEWK